jgi:AmmeMemoRadiSam system protein A
MAIGFVKTGERPKAQPTTSSAEAGSLTPAERATLLQIARDSATAALERNKPIDPRSPKYQLTEAMQKKAGAFVTLKNRGELRGCIGYIEARGPLVDAVVDNAINASTQDYRFADRPVTAKEMPEITIEISVMSPLQRVNGPSEIVLGKHGVVLTRGMRRSVFLPQVATETGWTLEMFLSRLSAKAGLSPDAWKQDGTRFEVFTAEVFGEPERSHGSK